MAAADWQKLEELFNLAVDLPPAEQREFVARECGDNAELLASLRSLLEQADTPVEFDSLLERSAHDLFASSELTAGSRAGSYRIIRKIGEGGMGTVYMAARADDEYQQHVAIKIINRLAGDNDEVMRRFRDERQILANLQHPNICRLLDGGSMENDSPFLVMEYVDGERIDSYCARHELSVDDILALFVKVCNAVQHAHQNLVVHRDLKPSNILIGADGEPKLLDFGVAKLLKHNADSHDPQTELGERVLTPLYSSPEQLSGEPVSTVSDIYSLGVILYELLVGKRPFDGQDTGSYAYARRILEADAPAPSRSLERGAEAATDADPEGAPHEITAWHRPGGLSVSQLRRRLVGDLDNIVLMALRTEPQRRYQAAGRLAADLECFSQRRPVSARSQSWQYLASRFIQRNRLATALMLGFVLTVSGLAYALFQQASLLRVERDYARDQFARASAVLTLVESVFNGLHPDNSGGEEVTVRQMLDVAGAQLDDGVGNFRQPSPEVNAVVRRILGQTYNDLGMIAPAKRHLGQALRLHRSGQFSADEEKFKTLVELSESHHLAFEEDVRLDLSLEALALSERLYGPDAQQTLDALSAVASSYHMLGRLQQAKLYFSEIFRRWLELLGERNPKTLASQANVGVADFWLGNFSTALANFERCHSIAVAALGEQHTRTLRCLGLRALILETVGRYADAVQALQRHVELTARVMGPNHPDTLRSMHSLADAYRGLGQYDVAQQLFLEVLEKRRRALGAEHIETLQTEMKLARVYRLTQRYEQATALIEHALSKEIEQLGFEHPSTLIAAQEQAELLVAMGQLDRAENLLQRILAGREQALGADHPELQNTLVGLARVDLARHRDESARQFLMRALALSEQSPEFQPQDRSVMLELLISVNQRLGDEAAALQYQQQLAYLK